jgi:alcohol dehydrogenase (cytochrome c)
MSARNLLVVAVICVIGVWPWLVAAQGIDNYSPVTEARLLKPEPQNWLMYRGTYDGWGYSPLEQINTTNVKKLVPVWSLSTGVVEGHQAPPIVNNGVMFITELCRANGGKAVDDLWRFCCHNRDCRDYGQCGAGNLTICMRYTDGGEA